MGHYQDLLQYDADMSSVGLGLCAGITLVRGVLEHRLNHLQSFIHAWDLYFTCCGIIRHYN